MPAEKKNKDLYTMKPFAKHLFSANEMPNIKDNSDGAFRRIYHTKYENEFLSGVNRIEGFDVLILKEKSAIFNMILENYTTLKRNNGFRYKQSVAQVREIIKKESDKLQQFVDECFIKNVNGIITKSELYELYVKYCDDNRLEKKAKNAFGSNIQKYGFKDGKQKKVKGENQRVWLGFRFNKESDWNKNNVKGLMAYT